MYEDDEEEDQTKEVPTTRGDNPAPEQRMTMTAAPGGGDIRTMAAPGAAGGRQMPWQRAGGPLGGLGGGRNPQNGGVVGPQGPGQGAQRPDWAAIINQFRQRFQQRNPFLNGSFGGPQQGAPQGAPPPQQGAPAPAPQPAPASPTQGNRAPWQGQIDQIAARFGNRQPGGILGGRGQY